MSSLDLINMLFQCGAAAVLLLNIKTILHDRELRGISWAMVLFFTVWDYWCVFYYAMIDQPASVIGATAAAVIQTVWVALAAYYTIRHRRFA